MKTHVISVLFLSAITFSSCNTNTTSTEDAGTSPANECVYNYDAKSTVIEWTAYKTSEKVAVKGTFTNLTLNETLGDEDPLKVLTGSSFDIPVISVNSQNPERDKRINDNFFGAMANTSSISGVIKSFDTGDGSVSINIKLNDVTRELKAKYKLSSEGLLSIDATLNMDNFNAQDAIASLNKACGDLHKGADGVSKLWPEVTLHVETKLSKECK